MEDNSTIYKKYKQYLTLDDCVISDTNEDLFLVNSDITYFYDKLPIGLKILYSFTGSSKSSIFKDDLHFISLDKMYTCRDSYIHFIDIATKYAGMGHILVLSYQPSTEMFFFRSDGGSNGYDRMYYDELYKHYIPHNNTNDKLTEKPHFIFNDIIEYRLMTFDDALDMLIQSKPKNF